MIDYNSIVSTVFITASFERISKDEVKVLFPDGSFSNVILLEDGTFSSDNEEALNQYILWMSRPERKVGQLVNIEGKTLDQLMSMYEQLLIGAYLLRFPDTDVCSDAPYAKMIDWLRSTDFYRAPASTVYHESVVGGLVIHSLKVYNEAVLINRLPKFRKVPLSSIAIVSLTHDWCKINTYESYKRNVKNEETGQWEQIDSFKRNLTGLTLGHGVTSMFYALKYMNLSEEECAAIRFHMGHWNICDPEINELQKCNESYPLVHLLQFADQLSIVSY